MARDTPGARHARPGSPGRRRCCRIVRLAAALAFAAGSGSLSAAPWGSLTPLTDTQIYQLTPTLKVTAVAWLGRTPLAGSAGHTHVALEITNTGPRPETVAIVPNGSFDQSALFGVVGMVPKDRITVGAGMTVRTDLFAEAWAGGANRGATLEIVPDGNTLMTEWTANFRVPTTTGNVQTRVAAVTASLANREGKDACLGLGWTEDDVLGIVDPVAHGPGDWRGWTILTDIAMTTSDWSALSAATREGLVQWAALGGRALIFGRGQPPTGLPNPADVGAGSITFHDLDLDLDVDVPPDSHPSRTVALPSAMWQSYGYGPSGGATISGENISWGTAFARLADPFGQRRLPVVLLLAFVALFGLLAGPINVLLLAKPPRRSRIFATTPLVSLAATGLLLLLMFLRDGTGGTGIRRPLCLLLPEQKALAVIQEQFSRTGVLLGSDAPIAERSWMRSAGMTNPGRRFIEGADGWRRGDWFHGRSDQAFVLHAVRPSRGRIDVVDTAPDGTPTLVSSLDVVLDSVVYRDAEGRVWTAADLPAGARRACLAATADEWKRGVDLIRSDAGPLRDRAINRVVAAPGTVIAVARDAEAFAIQTHRSIRWRDERVAFIGPVTVAGGESRP